MSLIDVQSYLITEIVPKLPKLYTPSKLYKPSVKVVQTPPSARYLETDFEICCGIVFTIVKFIAAGIVLVYTSITGNMCLVSAWV